jgi:hypothetical protein
MICINREPTPKAEDNKALCVIQSDTTPATMPLDGTIVDGLDDHTKIAAGSILYVVATGKRYFMNEAENGWNEFGAGETPATAE